MNRYFLPLFLAILVSCQPENTPLTDEDLRQKSLEMARELIIVDTHIDVPYRLVDRPDDISGPTEKGDFDYPRAKKGGLDGAFMSIYVPAKYEEGGAKAMADSLIDMVTGICENSPEKFRIAEDVAAIRNNHAAGIISFPMGMENGSPVEGDLGNLEYFYNKGIRYITLAHSRNNHICDSSYDTERKWNGLSPFGVGVVAEMNRLGMMIDVSHISDSAFYQVMRHSEAPVIASHSSCRAFTPDWERNMDDEMIQLLARNGGVIQINFGSAFLTKELRSKWSTAWGDIREYLDEHGLDWQDDEAQPFITKYREENGVGFADISDVIAHIDHVVRLVGPDHVGFGSDFDGVGDSLPVGIKDVSMYPNLIYEMLKLGYSDEDIRKICGENLLRVWTQVEETAANLKEYGSGTTL